MLIRVHILPFSRQYGQSDIEDIEDSRIVPSKFLAKMLSDAIKGNPFFSYDEAQASSVAQIVETAVDNAKYGGKRTLIIRGGAGTGKSVVAINALGQMINNRESGHRLNAVYVTSNAAPRNLYTEELVAGDYTRTSIEGLFKYPKDFGNARGVRNICDRIERNYNRRLAEALKKQYYDAHARLNDPKATDAVIYTEDVVIFKTDTDLPKLMPKEDWVKADIITCAAPDLRTKANIHFDLTNGGVSMQNAELFGYHIRRAIHLLTVAAAKGVDILVLGAFGCGAFQNDPKVVARAYRIAIKEFEHVFRNVEFAVYCPPTGSSVNYDAFNEEFKTII